MPCLTGDSQFECLYLKVFHKCLHSIRNCSKIVVIHLLVFGTLMSHQCSSCEHQVWSSRIESFIHKEILLLPSQVTRHFLHLRIEVFAHLGSSLIYSMQCSQQWRLIIKCFSRIRDKYRGYAECIIDDKHRRRWVPCRVTSCFESVSYSTVRERTGIWFLLYEQFSTEVLYHSPFTVVLHEGIVFLCRALSEGLEPVGVMGHSHLHRPSFHSLCHCIGY